jgi:hypothetical protein
MTPKPSPPKSPPPPSPVEPPDDKILTVRVAPELYEAIVAEAKAARHSINSAATILLEQALEARGTWKPNRPKEPFWKTPGWNKGPKK